MLFVKSHAKPLLLCSSAQSVGPGSPKDSGAAALAVALPLTATRQHWLRLL